MFVVQLLGFDVGFCVLISRGWCMFGCRYQCNCNWLPGMSRQKMTHYVSIGY